MKLKIFNAYKAIRKKIEFTFIQMYSIDNRETYTYITSISNDSAMIGSIQIQLGRYDIVDLKLTQDEVIKLIEQTEHQIAKHDLYSVVFCHKEFIKLYWDKYSHIEDLNKRKKFAFKALKRTGVIDSRKFNLCRTVDSIKKFELMLDIYIFDKIKEDKGFK